MVTVEVTHKEILAVTQKKMTPAPLPAAKSWFERDNRPSDKAARLRSARYTSNPTDIMYVESVDNGIVVMRRHDGFDANGQHKFARTSRVNAHTWGRSGKYYKPISEPKSPIGNTPSAILPGNNGVPVAPPPPPAAPPPVVTHVPSVATGQLPIDIKGSSVTTSFGVKVVPSPVPPPVLTPPTLEPHPLVAYAAINGVPKAIGTLQDRVTRLKKDHALVAICRALSASFNLRKSMLRSTPATRAKLIESYVDDINKQITAGGMYLFVPVLKSEHYEDDALILSYIEWLETWAISNLDGYKAISEMSGRVITSPAPAVSTTAIGASMHCMNPVSPEVEKEISTATITEPYRALTTFAVAYPWIGVIDNPNYSWFAYVGENGLVLVFDRTNPAFAPRYAWRKDLAANSIAAAIRQLHAAITKDLQTLATENNKIQKTIAAFGSMFPKGVMPLFGNVKIEPPEIVTAEIVTTGGPAPESSS